MVRRGSRLLLCPWVGGIVGVTQAFLGDVGVDLGGGEGGVPQEGLDASQVGSIVEQVGGEGVSQLVGGDVEGNVGQGEVLLEVGHDVVEVGDDGLAGGVGGGADRTNSQLPT